jgi:NAD(P)-dependent dehydrogenase (short-subunit alcohol dehydrogenase family)
MRARRLVGQLRGHLWASVRECHQSWFWRELQLRRRFANWLAIAGFDVGTATVDVSSRESVHALAESAAASGDITGVIHAAGVSPSQAEVEVILAVDPYGTALVLEEFGNVIASGGAGAVIASQSGHRLGALSAEEDRALATTPTDELLGLPIFQPDQITDTLHAYQARQARELAPSHGRSGALGQARCQAEHHQPRHHHHPSRQG